VTLDGRVVAYSVTVTLDAGATAADADGGAQRLHDAYLALDLPNLVADRFVFLPATPAMLDGFVPTPAVPGRLVLTLPAGFERTPDAVERAAVLRGLGMLLALDGYRGEPAQDALLPQLSFVVVGIGSAPLAPLVHTAHAAQVRVLVTGATDDAALDDCRAAGVDGIVGGSSAPPAPRPTDAGARVLRAGEAQCLALLHLLHEDEPDFGAISQVIDTDPVLVLRVLHLVNSGAFALRHSVDTVSQAVVLVGAQELRTLVAALMLDARPDAMDSLWLILARALTCETLAQDSAAYTVGMLSALSEQLGIPASVIVEKVGVSPAVADAVRFESGELGNLLHAVRAHERADTLMVIAAGLQPEEVSAVYMQCVSDALETARAVTREPAL
jgi:EAL and modified HD-GYP domain-containing signal transduction protein